MPRFNADTYAVIDKITGDEIDIKIFVERVTKDKWQKSYAQTMADYIGVGGNDACKLLAYIITEKDSKNTVHGTYEEIALGAGISRRYTASLMKRLIDRGFIKRVRNGCYFLDPDVICYGKKLHGAMLMRIWGEL